MKSESAPFVERTIDVPCELLLERAVPNFVENRYYVDREIDVQVQRVVEAPPIERAKIVRRAAPIRLRAPTLRLETVSEFVDVEVPRERVAARCVDAPRKVELERVVERPNVTTRVVDRRVERVVERRVEVPIERVVEVPQIVEEERLVEVVTRVRSNAAARFEAISEALGAVNADTVKLEMEIGAANDFVARLRAALPSDERNYLQRKLNEVNTENERIKTEIARVQSEKLRQTIASSVSTAAPRGDENLQSKTYCDFFAHSFQPSATQSDPFEIAWNSFEYVTPISMCYHPSNALANCESAN